MAIELKDIRHALVRIQSEYREMPEMKLTLPQAKRLLNLPVEVCAIALTSLVDSGFLAFGSDGTFHRGSSMTAVGVRRHPANWPGDTLAG